MLADYGYKKMNVFTDFFYRWNHRKSIVFHQSFKSGKHYYTWSVFKQGNCFVVLEVITFHGFFFDTSSYYYLVFSQYDILRAYLDSEISFRRHYALSDFNTIRGIIFPDT